MRAGLITAITASMAWSAVLAAPNEPVYLGIDAKGARHESKESRGSAPWIQDVTHAHMPGCPPYPLRMGYQGVGIFRLEIDPKTGATRNVTIVRSTGHIAFDRSGLLALKLWEWKPGTWTQVDIPMFFQRGGGVLIFPRYTTLPGWPKK